MASLQGQPRPKAGVFAVREAPLLAHNLKAALLQQPLKAYRAQRAFLSLLSFGDGKALATRAGGWLPALTGRWVWRWKDHIDRRFMAMFSRLTPRTMDTQEKPAPVLWGEEPQPVSALAMRCGGCGAKVGAQVLANVVGELTTVVRDDVQVGLQAPDDAAVLALPANTPLVQSVDQFRALVDDPFEQGRLAALHALSDLFAMGAQPQSAQALVTLPYARAELQARDLRQLMAGALRELNRVHCQLTGGHTSEGAELSMGFVVNGLGRHGLLTKTGLQPGDQLLLTKPLGTGCLFAARAQGATQGRWIDSALQQMTQSNGPAAECLAAHGARACTDVTGFGLVGHLAEMLRPAGLSATLDLAHLPILPGALACLARGITSSLQPQNLQLRTALAEWPQWQQHPRAGLLFDPQTNGGLLAGLPSAQLETTLEELKNLGYRAAVIGTVSEATEALINLTDSAVAPT